MEEGSRISSSALFCDCSTENFASLSDEQLKQYAEQFRYPEKSFRDLHNCQINSVQYDPTRGWERER